MLQTRVIPILLLKDGGLYKGEQFKKHKYVGDPINAVKIFNDKEVDEICILDIDASRSGTSPDFALIENIASQAFMPLGYGGGVKSVDDIERLFRIGIEKVVLNTAAYENQGLIKAASDLVGSQSIVCSIDVKKGLFGKEKAYIKSGTKSIKMSPVDLAKHYEQQGAGELIVNSIERDGKATGYDLDLIQRISKVVDIPIVAACGAGKNQHFVEAVKAGASAVAAGDIFTFQGKRKAVLITYPQYDKLQDLFKE
ncbi:imidazole glycerol phosphate synthase subunit HisF [Pseudoalteromonas rubra]|uniref:imidazole glycerol-phosphate synthase n=1 Tax=Pseudoalteromonas rubra TaxID=43658 RepID=A0A5S3WRI1_9GAMM|nr:AglZ/HisF2 family acetamidino modification protein [Pseudoalteromonas rubra]TMP31447.1 imidazole glycerol phosphate synthase subunit HisF [Pseudoalteromonas rubra]TMP34532.1 imidazole glycerol phosphate synthase subunit HisF [Pseudoalteromonas rubra]